jgi:hypothetical protein
LYLEKQLQENGVDTRGLSKACLQEFTGIAIDEAKRRSTERGSRGHWKTHVTTVIEGKAIVIKHAIDGTSRGENYNQLRVILRKHRVELKGSDTAMD